MRITKDREMRRTGTALLHTEELESTKEAAVLFAASFVDAAIDLLRAETERSMDSADTGAWLMLLEVYHLTGRRSDSTRSRRAIGALSRRRPRLRGDIPPRSARRA
jgi:hypothetical protein